MRQRWARLAYDHAQLSLAHVTATIIMYPLSLILSLRSARPHPSSQADGDDQLYIVITPPRIMNHAENILRFQISASNPAIPHQIYPNTAYASLLLVREIT